MQVQMGNEPEGSVITSATYTVVFHSVAALSFMNNMISCPAAPCIKLLIPEGQKEAI